MVVKMIETPRLILRQWLETDYSRFAEMSSDPKVMEHFPKMLSRSESDAYIDKLKAIIQKQGWGFWAVELKETHSLLVLWAYMINPHNFPFHLALKLVGA